MRCYICNTYIDEPKFDSRDGKIRPCSNCENVIEEALSDFDTGDTGDQLEFDFDEDETYD